MELAWVQRFSVVVIGAASTILALFVPSVYGMFIMAADIIFVIMLPQLVSVVFVSYANSTGALFGYMVGLVMRVGAGEPLLQLPAFLFFPWYSRDYGQLFPFRVTAMMCSLITIVGVSKVSELISNKWNRGSERKVQQAECVNVPLTCDEPDISQIKNEKVTSGYICLQSRANTVV